MADNAQQIEYWNGEAGKKWADRWKTMDDNLSDIADAVLSYAAAQAGEKVLDIGCGCGGTSLKLAAAVGPKGSVKGVDISGPMLSVARERAKEEGVKNVDFVESDAATADFKPEYDLVFSRFGVMFFADPVAAFANIRKGLKPGGRLAFVCWRPMPENQWAFTPLSAARPFLPDLPPPDPTAPGPFAFADVARVKSILEQAGFSGVVPTKLDSKMWMGRTVDEAIDQAMGIGPLARALAEVDDDATKQKIREVVTEAVTKLSSADGVALNAACWLVGATA